MIRNVNLNPRLNAQLIISIWDCRAIGNWNPFSKDSNMFKKCENVSRVEKGLQNAM